MWFWPPLGKSIVSCAILNRLCKSMATECWVPVCMMDAIIAARLLERIGENMLLSTNGQCYLWTGGRKYKNNNYSTITGHLESGKKGSNDAHHVSYCRTPHKIRGHSRYWSMQVICATTARVRLRHITLEPHSVNNNRIACVNRKKCSGYAPFPDFLLTRTLRLDGKRLF